MLNSFRNIHDGSECHFNIYLLIHHPPAKKQHQPTKNSRGTYQLTKVNQLKSINQLNPPFSLDPLCFFKNGIHREDPPTAERIERIRAERSFNMSVDPRPLLATSSEVRVPTSRESGEECFLVYINVLHVYIYIYSKISIFIYLQYLT